MSSPKTTHVSNRVYDLTSIFSAEADRRAGDLPPDAAVRRLVRRQHARFHGETLC